MAAPAESRIVQPCPHSLQAPRISSTPCLRHRQCIGDDIGRHARLGRPANHLSVEQVQRHRQVQASRLLYACKNGPVLAKGKAEFVSKDEKPDGPIDRIHKGAQIFALVFTPLAVAAAGWAAQWSVSNQGVRKDLIQMSLQVLKEPRRDGDEALRQCALDTINRNSEVRLSDKAADQLSSSAVVMLKTNPFLKPAMEPRPRCPTLDLKAVPASQVRAVTQLQELCNRNQQDLFWMQKFGGLLLDYRPEAASAPR